MFWMTRSHYWWGAESDNKRGDTRPGHALQTQTSFTSPGWACELPRRSLHKMAHLSDNPGLRQSQKCIFCCVVIAWIEAHWANSRGQLWWVTPGGRDREWDTWVLDADRCRPLSLHFASNKPLCVLLFIITRLFPVRIRVLRSGNSSKRKADVAHNSSSK